MLKKVRYKRSGSDPEHPGFLRKPLAGKLEWNLNWFSPVHPLCSKPHERFGSLELGKTAQASWLRIQVWAGGSEAPRAQGLRRCSLSRSSKDSLGP